MMDVETLIQLIGSGNPKAVEEEWMSALSDDGTSVRTWQDRLPLLKSMVDSGNGDIAAELAWATLETLREKTEAEAILPLATAMLQILPDAGDLRDLATDLYRKAHPDAPNIVRLLDEAGLDGAKTPRRAVRTLDVCLSLKPGAALVGRHEDTAARVEAIDPETWEVTLTTPRRTRTVDPTSLADDYAPAEPDDYRYLLHFNHDRLIELLHQEPGRLVKSIVRAHGDRMTSDALEVLLVPDLVSTERWAKWWSNARTQIKRAPDMRLEGRNPSVLIYDPDADTLEEEALDAFRRVHDGVGNLKVVNDYVRECKSRRAAPDSVLLCQMAETLEAKAERQRKSGSAMALETLLVAARARQAADEDDADARPRAFLCETADPVASVKAIEVHELWDDACEALVQADRDKAPSRLAELLLVAPMSACDGIANRMIEMGYPLEEFDELVQEITAEPFEHGGPLFWLWAGPTNPDLVRSTNLSELLQRILMMLADLKRSDKLDRDLVKSIKTDVRTALAARKYKQFRACIESVDPGRASAFYSQIKRADELGRAVREDLLTIISEKFPDLHARPKVAPWDDTSVLYVTSRGMASKQAEIRDHVNIKMRENAIAIGKAAELGDLSENAEYKFALEERDLLRARLAQMNAEMAMARPLEPSDVPKDYVGIGSRVALRHADSGQQREVTILGPWEANAEKGILNYKAPFARSLLGLKPGETVEMTFPDAPGTYVVESCDNAIAD